MPILSDFSHEFVRKRARLTKITKVTSSDEESVINLILSIKEKSVKTVMLHLGKALLNDD